MLSNYGAREDSWESLDRTAIKPVNPKGNQPWMFIGRTDTKAETPILWPPDANSRLTGKNPDAGKDWGQEEKGVTEDGITNSIDVSLSKLREIAKDREAWHAAVGLQRVGHDWVTEQLNSPASLLSPEMRAWDWMFPPSNHVIAFSGNEPPSLAAFTKPPH